jgi:Cysteine rich repeat
MSSNSVLALCAGLLALAAAPIAAPAQNAPPAPEQGAPPGPGQIAPGGSGSGPLAACRADLAQFCSQLQPGGGRISACIREHFAELSPGCKQALIQARQQRQQQRQQQQQ